MCCLSGSRWRGRIAPVTSLAAIPGIHPWPRPGPREGADGDCSAKLKGCRRLGTALAGASPPAGAWRRPWAASATELSERRAEFPARADAKLGKHLAQVPFDGADGQEQRTLRRQDGECQVRRRAGQVPPSQASLQASRTPLKGRTATRRWPHRLFSVTSHVERTKVPPGQADRLYGCPGRRVLNKKHSTTRHSCIRHGDAVPDPGERLLGVTIPQCALRGRGCRAEEI